MRVWDATTGREVLGLRGHTDSAGAWRSARTAGASPRPAWTGPSASGTRPRSGGTRARKCPPSPEHDDEIRSVAVSPDGERIVSAGRRRRLVEGLGRGDRPADRRLPRPHGARLLRGLAPRRPAHRHGRLGRPAACRQGLGRAERAGTLHDPGRGGNFAVPFLAVAFGPDPDGRYLVTGKQDGAVQVWDARTGQQVRTLGTHGREVRGVVFSPDGKHLASASGDGEVKLWDATRLDEEQEAPPPAAPGAGPRAEPERGVQPGRPAAGDRGRRRTRSRSGTCRRARSSQTLRGHSGEVYTVAFSPNDKAGGSPRGVRTAR